MSPYDAAVVVQSFEAGALIRGDVRREFDRLSLRTDEFTYIESKGFFSSTFHLKGPRYLIRAMALLLEARYNEPYED